MSDTRSLAKVVRKVEFKLLHLSGAEGPCPSRAQLGPTSEASIPHFPVFHCVLCG